MKACKYCGSMIEDTAAACCYCGRLIDVFDADGKRPENRNASMQRSVEEQRARDGQQDDEWTTLNGRGGNPQGNPWQNQQQNTQQDDPWQNRQQNQQQDNPWQNRQQNDPWQNRQQNDPWQQNRYNNGWQNQQYQQPVVNGMGVAAFVCGLISIFLGAIFIPQILAVIFGIIGMVQIKNAPQKYSNKWMPIAGLIIGAAFLVLYIVVMAVVMNSLMANSDFWNLVDQLQNEMIFMIR